MPTLPDEDSAVDCAFRGSSSPGNDAADPGFDFCQSSRAVGPAAIIEDEPDIFTPFGHQIALQPLKASAGKAQDCLNNALVTKSLRAQPVGLCGDDSDSCDFDE